MKYTLVTGATGGIGYEIAKVFARNKHNLILVARNQGKLEKIKIEFEKDYSISVVVISMDLSNIDAAKDLYEKTTEEGYIVDNLVNNAAFCAGPNMSIYYATKAYVLSFSEAVAEELKGTGVTVTALCPGPTATGFEKAAEMKNSKMFTFFKPASAEAVARYGYNKMMKGKVVAYYGMPTNIMNIGSRLSPRSITRKFAKAINGIPERK